MIDKLLASFQELADQIIVAAPQVVIGIVLVLLALIVAKVVEKILRVVLVRVRFDGLVGRVGIDKTLQRLGIRQQLSLFIPRVIYFLLLMLLAKTAADAFELTAISNALGSLFVYLPHLIAALLLVVIGSAVAQFAGRIVTQAAEESGIEFAPALGRIVSGLILFIVSMMAVGQLKIDTEIIRIVTSFVLAGLAVAFGLSFGLGSRDVIRNIMAGYYAKRVLRVGATIEINGQRGILKGITATHTVIQGQDETINVANVSVLESVAKQGTGS